MKTKKVTARIAEKQLLECGFVKDRGYYKGRDFYARIVTLTIPQIDGTNSSQQLTLQLSVKKSHDRWANSVDFEVDLQNVRAEWLNLKKSIRHARRILRSGLFDFNRYFHGIQIDWD